MIEFDEYSRLDGKEAQEFASSSISQFRLLEPYGPSGVLGQADITFTASKCLRPSAMSAWGLRLSRYNQVLDLSFLRELGRRRAIANAGLSSLSASAQLHILSQPAAAFDSFFSTARQEDRMGAHDIRAEVSSVFARPVWLG